LWQRRLQTSHVKDRRVTIDKVPTICPYCGCGCGLYLHEDNGTIVGISPVKNHPVNKGSLCVKGWSCFEFIQHPDRLQYPLIQENGSFRQASWHEALKLIATRLSEIKKASGPDAIGILSSAKSTNEENYLMMKFARAVIGTNNIDHCARLCHSSTVGGLADAFGSGAMTNSINEIAHARLLFVIGSDTTNQHPMIGMHMLDAVDNGAILIVADPRKTQIADFAHIHLQHRLGTDVALLNSIMNVILREELVDISFVKRRTENFNAFKNSIMKYSPEVGERITGVSAQDIEKVARLYATRKKSMLFYAMGITQHRTGVDNVCACANLTMLTAHIGIPKTGLNPLRGQNNVQGACDMGALPDNYSGYQKVHDLKSRKKFERAWGVKLPATPGLTLTEMFDAALKGTVRALYIMGENPLLSNPDVTHTIKALKKLDFLVVQDIFLSETAQYAHVVLPAATFAEKDGTFTNTERRVQKIQPAIKPFAESKPDWEIISAIAREMNYDMYYRAPHEIMEEIALLTPIYRGIPHHRLDNNFGLQWPCPDVSHPGTPFLHQKKFAKGLGTFMPVDYKPPSELPDKKYPYILTTGRACFHYHTGTMSRRTTTLNRELPECFVEINRNDAESLTIRHMDMVKISSRRGEITVRALITDNIPEGVVFIPFHFKEAAVNLLTNPVVDPSAKIPEYKVCAVHVELAK
jgi:formate dehydrogenase alpha subunit